MKNYKLRKNIFYKKNKDEFETEEYELFFNYFENNMNENK